MKKFQSISLNYGVIIFAIAGVLLIPQFYYLANIQALSYDLLLVVIPVGLSLLVMIFGFLMKSGNNFQLVAAGFGLSILLCDQLLRADIGHLDGFSSETIRTDSLLVSLNGILYFGLPLAFLFFGRKLEAILIDLSYVMLALAVCLTLYVIYSTVFHAEPERFNINENKREGHQRPNVYFIWLDAMETQYMKKYISDYSGHYGFPGFSLFENNSSNYLYTNTSYSSFMSGTVYEGGDYVEWSERKDDLRKFLKDKGYRITSYVKKEFGSSLDDVSYSSSSIYMRKANSKHPFITDFIAYWLVRSVPSFFANYSLPKGVRIGKKVDSWVNSDTEYSKVKTISDGIEPLTGVFTLDMLIEEEEKRNDHNEFVLAQAVIPHGPYVIDKNCKYRGRSSKNRDHLYYQQVICSVGKVQRFLSKLKEMGRYDSSIIVVMGDHGAGWTSHKDGEEALNARYQPWSKSAVISRASALLMIKAPGKISKGSEVSTLQKESQLVDIYPTILSALGYESEIGEDVLGIDLFSNEIQNREKYITYFKPGLTIDLFDAEIYDLFFQSPNGLIEIKYRGDFVQNDNLASFGCNQKLSFSADSPSAGSFIGKGLGAPETWGRWSDNKVVSIKVKFDVANCAESQLTLLLRAFVTDQNPVQTATIVLNGETLGVIEIGVDEENPQRIDLDIPFDLIDSEVTSEIEFYIDDPKSPAELGVSTDKRQLGFGFHYLVIH